MALSTQAMSKMEKPCVSKTGVRMAKPSLKSIPKIGLTHPKWSHGKAEPEMVTSARFGRILVKRIGTLVPLLQPRRSPNTFLGTMELAGRRRLDVGRDHGSREQNEVPEFQIENDDISKDSHEVSLPEQDGNTKCFQEDERGRRLKQTASTAW